MGKLKRGQTRYDRKPMSEGMKAALFVNGPNVTVTAETAYNGMNQGGGAAEARARMLARMGIRDKTDSAEKARERMIRRDKRQR